MKKALIDCSCFQAYNAKTINVSFADDYRRGGGSGASTPTSRGNRRGGSSGGGRTPPAGASGRHQGRGGSFDGGNKSGTRQRSGSMGGSGGGPQGGRGRSGSGATPMSSGRHTPSILPSGSVEDPNLPALQRSAARWQIGAAGSTNALGETAKKIKGILNKITLEKFQKLSQDLMELIIETVKTMDQLTEVVNLIFDKALAEPSFGMIYADLCARLNQVWKEKHRIEIIRYFVTRLN